MTAPDDRPSKSEIESQYRNLSNSFDEIQRPHTVQFFGDGSRIEYYRGGYERHVHVNATEAAAAKHNEVGHEICEVCGEPKVPTLIYTGVDQFSHRDFVCNCNRSMNATRLSDRDAAEVGMIDDLLSKLPSERVIERIGLESRRRDIVAGGEKPQNAPENAAAAKPAQDIESLVCDEIKARQRAGIAKYGTTVAANPLTLRQWLQHALEECCDQAVYLRRAIAEIDAAEPSVSDPNPESELSLGDFVRCHGCGQNPRRVEIGDPHSAVTCGCPVTHWLDAGSFQDILKLWNRANAPRNPRTA